MNDILLADAGSTKTDWSLLSDEEQPPLRFKTEGINPAHDKEEVICSIISKIKEKTSRYPIKKIFFFGSGCATPELTEKIYSAFNKIYNKTEISVKSDLLGAGIALFGMSEGIASILGTGSATGLFSNGEIKYQIPSLGYIIGDEGGGVSLGKRLLNSIFKKQLSSEIIEKFQHQYKLTLTELINSVYIQTKPAAYIASFSPFIKNNIGFEELENLAISEFDSFFEKNILPYKDHTELKIGLVGSVADSYSEIIKKSALKFDITVSSIVREPLPLIEKYYLGK